MGTTFIVIRNNGERCCVLHNADVFLRKNNGKWTLIVESATNLEMIQFPRRDIAINEFERITREIVSGARAVTIKDNSPA